MNNAVIPSNCKLSNYIKIDSNALSIIDIHKKIEN